ncbi:MAG: magnesium transporter, partial [Anaerolineae bacterium]|nr:magnesium transporter [Anaerolineae bacterium]
MNPTDVDNILDQVREALAREDWTQAVTLVEALRPPDQADIFGELPPSEQDVLLPRLDVEDSADILEELEEEEAAEIAARLEPAELADILDEMEPDEAADLLGDIAPAYAAEVLAAMEEPEEIRPLLVHSDESAGGLMTSVRATLHKDMTVEQAFA